MARWSVRIGPVADRELVNKESNAQQHQAVVHVQTDGVEVVDPESVHSIPNFDQAHIQYQIDGGEIVNSTSLVMVFRNLASGEHRIQVALAANDNKPIGHQTTLEVHVPK